MEFCNFGAIFGHQMTREPNHFRPFRPISQIKEHVRSPRLGQKRGHPPSLWLQIQFRVLDNLTPLVMLSPQECVERRRRIANWFDHLLEKNLTQSWVLHSLGNFTIEPPNDRG